MRLCAARARGSRPGPVSSTPLVRCVHPTPYVHPGVVDTKVGDFGGKSTKVRLGDAIGTKPAKVADRPSWPTKAAKVNPKLFPVTEDLQICKNEKDLRSAGGPKLLKWGLPRRVK